MRIIACMYCLLFSFATYQAFGQDVLQVAFSQLQKGEKLPEDLQSTRSIVFLRTDQSSPLGSSEGLELLTNEFHRKLVDMHVDAVAYFRWLDLVAGYDATNSYLKAIRDREVSQIILLQAENGSFQIFIIPTVEEAPELFEVDQPVWHASGSSLEGVVEALSIAVRRSDLEISNFLISETPEIFIDTEIFQKNRFESFQPDLKLDKLAVPLFHSTDIDNIVDPEDQELKSIFESQYPFSFEVVSNQMTEDLMKKAGFHYVLRYLHAEESTLLTLMDYQDPTDDPGKKGYKFYVRHLISGDIYLGNIWDSRSSWQAALREHLTNLKRSLKVD